MPNELTLDEIKKTFRDKVVGKWIAEGRAGNAGSAGNTLEDLLGVEENNLKIADLGKYELKTHDNATSSLLTLLHREPKPRASVPKLLKALGWRHEQAGLKYDDDERSFRSTTRARVSSDRGLVVDFCSRENRIEFSFQPSEVARDKIDKTKVYATYGDWADDVEKRTNPSYKEIFPIYWEADVLANAIKTKLDHTLLTFYDSRGEDGNREFRFTSVVLLSGVKVEMIETLFEEHALYVDFDARTGHNHGTKIRIDMKHVSRLFAKFEKVI